MSDDLDAFDDDCEEPEYLHDRRFFEFVDLGGLPTDGTVAGRAGRCPERPTYLPEPTSLVLEVEEAWRTPFPDLTCAHVAALVQQKMALEALAEPILEFTARYPTAMIACFPGEMGLSVLRAGKDFLRLVPKEFRK